MEHADPFANSGLWGDAEGTPAPTGAGSTREGGFSFTQSSEKAPPVSSPSPFKFASGGDGLFSPASNAASTPGGFGGIGGGGGGGGAITSAVSTGFKVDTGMPQRNAASAAREMAVVTTVEDYNIPEFSQLEPVFSPGLHGEHTPLTPGGGGGKGGGGGMPTPFATPAGALTPGALLSPTPLSAAPLRHPAFGGHGGSGGLAGLDLFDVGAQNRDGAHDLGRWVVVFGFMPGDVVSPVRALQRHGEVTRHLPGRGQRQGHGGGTGGTGDANFLFVQFATSMDRDRAVSVGPTLLNDQVLINVSALSEDLAQRLGFQDTLDERLGGASGLRGGGGGTTLALLPSRGDSQRRHPTLRRRPPGGFGGGLGGGGGGGGTWRHGQPPVRPYAMAPHVDGVGGGTLGPTRHVNICKRITRALFGW